MIKKQGDRDCGTELMKKISNTKVSLFFVVFVSKKEKEKQKTKKAGTKVRKFEWGRNCCLKTTGNYLFGQIKWVRERERKRGRKNIIKAPVKKIYKQKTLKQKREEK